MLIFLHQICDLITNPLRKFGRHIICQISPGTFSGILIHPSISDPIIIWLPGPTVVHIWTMANAHEFHVFTQSIVLRTCVERS